MSLECRRPGRESWPSRMHPDAVRCVLCVSPGACRRGCGLCSSRHALWHTRRGFQLTAMTSSLTGPAPVGHDNFFHHVRGLGRSFFSEDSEDASSQTWTTSSSFFRVLRRPPLSLVRAGSRGLLSEPGWFEAGSATAAVRAPGSAVMEYGADCGSGRGRSREHGALAPKTGCLGVEGALRPGKSKASPTGPEGGHFGFCLWCYPSSLPMLAYHAHPVILVILGVGAPVPTGDPS